MNEKITINDIAEACGVSIATVSLVLNNRPGTSQKTRTRVIEAATSMGYFIRPATISNRCGRLSRLGLLSKAELSTTPQANPFYSKVIFGIEEACRRSGISLLFSMLPVDENNYPLEYPALLNGEDIDGLLMLGTFVDKTVLSVGGNRQVPVVLVDSYSDTQTFDTVVSDNFRAAYQAVDYLIKKGHHHIAIAGGKANAYPSLKDRRNGYLRALKENGIAEIYMADFNLNNENKDTGYEAVVNLLGNHAQITALFCVNDDAATTALRAAKALGRRVPEDLSIIGYDDTYLATSASPMLTTMHVDTVGMGRAAVQLLAFRLDNPEAARLTLTIHPYLVERDSVAQHVF
ncbi:MAG: LacI family transcriptional regulator [Anaerolineae bacterium]|nr:LacI family transcriptional regulator [Anaerolineae bacterium]